MIEFSTTKRPLITLTVTIAGVELEFHTCELRIVSVAPFWIRKFQVMVTHRLSQVRSFCTTWSMVTPVACVPVLPVGSRTASRIVWEPAVHWTPTDWTPHANAVPSLLHVQLHDAAQLGSKSNKLVPAYV